jgi:hypothetical protein
MSKWWIQHTIGGTTRSCPWLSEDGKTYKPLGGTGWHPHA